MINNNNDFLLFSAIVMLRDKPAGSFVVRNSNTFQGAFGLALKVAQVPPNVQIKEGGASSIILHILRQFFSLQTEELKEC